MFEFIYLVYIYIIKINKIVKINEIIKINIYIKFKIFNLWIHFK